VIPTQGFCFALRESTPAPLENAQHLVRPAKAAGFGHELKAWAAPVHSNAQRDAGANLRHHAQPLHPQAITNSLGGIPAGDENSSQRGSSGSRANKSAPEAGEAGWEVGIKPIAGNDGDVVSTGKTSEHFCG
jgi:hypothetical protein